MEAAAETRGGGAPPSRKRKRKPLSERTNTAAAVLLPPPSKRITRSSAASSLLNNPPPHPPPPPAPNPITAEKPVDQTTEKNKQKSTNRPFNESAAAVPDEDALKKWMSRNFGDSFEANTTTGGFGFQSRNSGLRHGGVGKENIDPSTGVSSTLIRQLASSMPPPPPEKEKHTKRPLSEAIPEVHAPKKRTRRNFGDSVDVNTTTTVDALGSKSSTSGGHDIGKQNFDHSTDFTSTPVRQLLSSMPPPPPEKEKRTKRPLSEAVPQEDVPKKRTRRNIGDLVDVNTARATTTADTLGSKSSTSGGHNVDKENFDHSTDFTSMPVRQLVSSMPPPPPVEPMTVYARRRPEKSKGKEKVVHQAFSCPPLERPRSIRDTSPQSSNKTDSRSSDVKVSKSLTGPPKKRRKNDPAVLKDYLEKQRAYFAEIDKCELSEEEISESELSDQ